MISLDTTRRDHWRRYGGAADTPHLDALFDGGLVLDDHRSCSNWTYSSVLCFHAGMSDVELGYVPGLGAFEESAPDEMVTGAEILRDLGFTTALVSSNVFFSGDSNMDQGYDTSILRLYETVDVINQEALPLLDALAASGEAPWYFHIHYIDPHAPYSPPEEYLDGLDGLDPIAYDLNTAPGHTDMQNAWGELDEAERALIAEHLGVRYAGEMAYADAKLGELLERAESLGLLDDALVVFWTDHGEQLGEHGTVGHDADLFEKENRAVVAFAAPGLEAGGWGGPTLHQDIWPTTFAAMGIDPGVDHTGVEAGLRDPDVARLALRHTGGQAVHMAERGGVKLLYRHHGEKRLFRLGDDPDELVDVYDPHDPDVIALWEALLPQVEAAEALHPGYPAKDPGP